MRQAFIAVFSIILIHCLSAKAESSNSYIVKEQGVEEIEESKARNVLTRKYLPSRSQAVIFASYLLICAIEPTVSSFISDEKLSLISSLPGLILPVASDFIEKSYRPLIISEIKDFEEPPLIDESDLSNEASFLNQIDNAFKDRYNDRLSSRKRSFEVFSSYLNRILCSVSAKKKYKSIDQEIFDIKLISYALKVRYRYFYDYKIDSSALSLDSSMCLGTFLEREPLTSSFYGNLLKSLYNLDHDLVNNEVALSEYLRLLKLWGIDANIFRKKAKNVLFNNFLSLAFYSFKVSGLVAHILTNYHTRNMRVFPKVTLRFFATIYFKVLIEKDKQLLNSYFFRWFKSNHLNYTVSNFDSELQRTNIEIQYYYEKNSQIYRSQLFQALKSIFPVFLQVRRDLQANKNNEAVKKLIFAIQILCEDFAELSYNNIFVLELIRVVFFDLQEFKPEFINKVNKEIKKSELYKKNKVPYEKLFENFGVAYN